MPGACALFFERGVFIPPQSEGDGFVFEELIGGPLALSVHTPSESLRVTYVDGVPRMRRVISLG